MACNALEDSPKLSSCLFDRLLIQETNTSQVLSCAKSKSTTTIDYDFGFQSIDDLLLNSKLSVLLGVGRTKPLQVVFGF
jgi:hypothetical protein